MTTPPDPNTIAAIVDIGHRERDAAELRLKSAVQRHRVLLACIVIACVFAGWRGYVWHIEHMAKLEAQAGVEKTVATNEHKLGEKWKARAIALTDSVRVDTLLVRKIIHDVKTITVQVPVMPEPVQDGVTYSGPAPLVPIAVVSKLDFDSLGAACERVNHDCGAALAASDSARAHADSMAAALQRLNHNTEQRLKSTQRVSLLEKAGIAAFCYFLGRVAR
jgi:hypothetical protein